MPRWSGTAGERGWAGIEAGHSLGGLSSCPADTSTISNKSPGKAAGSPIGLDEALPEAQTHRVGGGGRGDGADQCGERVPDRGRAAAHLPESNSEGARDGLRLIGALYDIEEQIRDPRLTGEAKRLHA